MAGLEVNSLTSLEKSILSVRVADKNLAKFLEVKAIVTAITNAASVIVKGSGDFKNSEEALSDLRDFLLPQLAEDREDKAKKTAEIIRKEFESGPITIQALDYGRKKKKR